MKSLLCIITNSRSNSRTNRKNKVCTKSHNFNKATKKKLHKKAIYFSTRNKVKPGCYLMEMLLGYVCYVSTLFYCLCKLSIFIFWTAKIIVNFNQLIWNSWIHEFNQQQKYYLNWSVIYQTKATIFEYTKVINIHRDWLQLIFNRRTRNVNPIILNPHHFP